MGGHPPPRHSFLITVQSGEESYRHGGWTAESRWGALFKQRSTILPNLMETPFPAHPSAAHVFTWGYLLLNVRHRAAWRARWKWVGEENWTQNGKIRPLNVGEKQISFTWLLAQLTAVLEWERPVLWVQEKASKQWKWRGKYHYESNGLQDFESFQMLICIENGPMISHAGIFYKGTIMH